MDGSPEDPGPDLAITGSTGWLGGLVATDLAARGLAGIFQILRFKADRGEREYPSAVADRGPAIADDMRPQHDAGADKEARHCDSREKPEVQCTPVGEDVEQRLEQSYSIGS